MKIPVEHVDKIEEIMVKMRNESPQCRKDFRCYTSELEELCPVKGIGVFESIECESEDAQCCGFSFLAVETCYCRCPLRRYIAEHFHR